MLKTQTDQSQVIESECIENDKEKTGQVEKGLVKDNNHESSQNLLQHVEASQTTLIPAGTVKRIRVKD